MSAPREPDSLEPVEEGLAASAELEDSVASLKRAAFAFRKLCDSRETNISPRALHLSEQHLEKLVEIRNAVEHCENAIVQGDVHHDSLLMIQPRRSDFVMAGHVVRYTDYAAILRRLHTLAERLVARDQTLAR